MEEKDIIIIGGGPGGYAAAIRGAQLGAKVCLVEKDTLGGTCLNRGCIPTKTLYRNAEIINTLKNIDELGINIEGYHINISKIQERKQKIVNQLVDGIEQLMKMNKIEVVRGEGVLRDNRTVAVTLNDGSTRDIITKNIIIATGSKPTMPPIMGADTEGIYTSEELLNFTQIPNSMAIIGGGVIGMEFAGIFNALGSKVTVIEFLPNILPNVDTDLTKRLAVSLKKRGITIHTSTKVTKIEKDNDGFILTAEGKKDEIKIQSETVLISVGRTPITEKINMEYVGVEFDRRGIRVDENFETNIKGIYAVGDVTGKSMLAHAAAHQGVFVAEKIMGIEKELNHDVIPSCIFVFPEIASVGITENEAKDKNLEYMTSKFLFGANGKALTLGEPEGIVKVIANKDYRIMGVHIMGPHATELIHEGVLAVNQKLKAEDIGNMIHAHPTLSEAFAEAVLGLKGEALHMMPKK